MHVFGEYYALQRDRPARMRVVVAALKRLAADRITSITTLAGFISLWFTSTMPPIRYFGLFGSLACSSPG